MGLGIFYIYIIFCIHNVVIFTNAPNTMLWIQNIIYKIYHALKNPISINNTNSIMN